MRVTQATNNFRVYIGPANTPVDDVMSVELPEITMLANEVNVAGMAGKVNVPLLGQADTMTVKVNAAVESVEMVKAAIPEGQMLTVRCAMQVYDSAKGASKVQNRTYVMRATNSGLASGKIEKGAAQDSSASFELDYYKVMHDGKTVIEIDKWNNKFVVNGVDYASEVRNAI